MGVFKDLNFNIVNLDSVDSTNIHARQWVDSNSFEEGLVFTTEFQDAGKGQRGSKWLSDKKLNLLFSLVLTPNLSIDSSFLLSQMTSIAVIRVLDKLSVNEVKVKWPNDIFIANQKVGGILIENNIKGQLISLTIIGIGLNINQVEFPKFERKATSLKKVLGNEFNPRTVLDMFLLEVKSLYSLIQTNPYRINELYHKRLYGVDQLMLFETQNESFEGVIKGVSKDGNLLINRDGELLKFGVKEVKFKV